MYTLLKSGVPILRALSGLQDAAINPEMKRVIGEVRESLEGGRELSQALARHPRVFSPFYLSMVRVGEATGLLEEIFLRLFEHLEFERYMREQVKSALRYPMFVVAAMVAAIVIVNLFVIPAFAKVFAGFGAQLPLMTRILLAFSNFMVAYWPAMLGGLVAAAGAAQGEKYASYALTLSVLASTAVGVLMTLTGGIVALPLIGIVLYQAAWLVITLFFPLMQR